LNACANELDLLVTHGPTWKPPWFGFAMIGERIFQIDFMSSSLTTRRPASRIELRKIKIVLLSPVEEINEKGGFPCPVASGFVTGRRLA